MSVPVRSRLRVRKEKLLTVSLFCCVERGMVGEDKTADAVKVLQIDTFRKQACLCLILQHRLRLLPSNVIDSAAMLTYGRLRGYIDFIARPLVSALRYPRELATCSCCASIIGFEYGKRNF